MSAPRCFNRDPFTDPNAGWVDAGWVITVGGFFHAPNPEDHSARSIKKLARYRWPWFTDRCAAWDTGPGHIRDTVPAREGWLCDGCKHLPAHARAWIRGEDGE